MIGRVGDAPKPSEWPQFSESPRPDHFVRDGRRVSTNPILNISDLSGNSKLGGTVSASATPHLPSHGQVLTAHIQAPSSRRGSPLGVPDSMSITTRSVPATPLAGISNTMPAHLNKTPGTPISPEAQSLGARLTPQGTHQLGDSPLSSDLQSSISRLSGHSQYDNFDSGYDDPLHVRTFLYVQIYSLTRFAQPYGGDDAVYGLNNSVGNPVDDRRFNSYGNGNSLASTGSTALYHHHGSRYGLGIGGRVASDGKMNGLHGPKHRRGDVDRECAFLKLSQTYGLSYSLYDQSIVLPVLVLRTWPARFRACVRINMVVGTCKRSLRRVFRNTVT